MESAALSWQRPTSIALVLDFNNKTLDLLGVFIVNPVNTKRASG